MTLIDRLTAAIDAKEAKARATLTELFVGGDPDRPTGTTSGQWETYKVRDGEFSVRETDGSDVALAGGVDLCEESWTGLNEANAEHIADNDPASVIRMCQAHRRIVEDRRQAYVEMSEDEEPWDIGYRAALDHVVRLLAVGYGLTEEET